MGVRSTLALTWGVTAAAWVALGLLAPGAGGHGHGAGHPEGAAAAVEPAAVGLLVGWFVMVLAMMLPLSARLLVAVRRLVARRRRPALLVAAAASGVVLPWLVVGQLLQAGDLLVQVALAQAPWLDGRRGVLIGATLIAAGAIQFTGLKDRCLTACRTPVGFAARYWRGRWPAWESLHIGLAYGLSCVGCCWALMAVMFVLGMAAWVPMLVLAAVMAAERWAAWGAELSRWVGTAIVLGGIGLVVLSV